MPAMARTALKGLIVFCLNILCSFRNAAAQLVSTGQTLVLNDIPYYLPAEPFTTVAIGKRSGLKSKSGLVPVTVVGGSDDLQATVQAYGEVDDVWSTGFLGGEMD